MVLTSERNEFQIHIHFPVGIELLDYSLYNKQRIKQLKGTDSYWMTIKPIYIYKHFHCHYKY